MDYFHHDYYCKVAECRFHLRHSTKSLNVVFVITLVMVS